MEEDAPGPEAASGDEPDWEGERSDVGVEDPEGALKYDTANEAQIREALADKQVEE